MASDAQEAPGAAAPPFHMLDQDVRFMIYELYVELHCGPMENINIQLLRFYGSGEEEEHDDDEEEEEEGEYQNGAVGASLALALPKTADWATDRDFAFRAVYKRAAVRLDVTSLAPLSDGLGRRTLADYDRDMNAVVMANPEISYTKILRFPSMHHALLFLGDVLPTRTNRVAGVFTIDNQPWRYAFPNVDTVIVDVIGQASPAVCHCHRVQVDLPALLRYARTSAIIQPSTYWSNDHSDFVFAPSETGISYTGQEPICRAIIAGLQTRFPSLRTFAYAVQFAVWVRPLHLEAIEGKQSIWRRSPSSMVVEVVKDTLEGSELDTADCVKQQDGAGPYPGTLGAFIQIEDFPGAD